MTTKESYTDYGLSGVREYAESIKKAAALVGLPPEAIAGALAEEYEYKDYLGNAAVFTTLTQLKYGGGDHNIQLSDVEMQDFLSSPSSSHEWPLNWIHEQIMKTPIGPSSIHLETVIQWLENYSSTPSTDEYGVLQYTDNYYQLALDIIQNPDVSCLFTGLILKEADLIFSSDDAKYDLVVAYFPTDRVLPTAVFDSTELAWKLMDMDTKIGVMITYFNHGAKSILRNLVQTSTSAALTQTFIWGLHEDSDKAYVFPQYFPAPGPDTSGGHMYLDDKASLLKELGLPASSSGFSHEFLQIARLLYRNDPNAALSLSDGKKLLNLQKEIGSLPTKLSNRSALALKDLLELAENNWGCANATADNDIDNIFFVKDYSSAHSSNGNDIIIGFDDRGNILDGMDGHDEIYGGRLGDILNGSGGDDHLHGGSGRNELNGGEGQDYYYIGQGGFDLIYDSDTLGQVFYGADRNETF